ncbi:hypothetical protein AB4072_08770 [Microvirga sp. 2MCAF38]|uniref:hypothetical protein n=1 Tax=Microvirga sp. 2MCAF38 TaxID=3232989 RepID=UPI003F960F0C
MSSFWIVFIAQVSIVGIVIVLWQRNSGLSEVLSGGILMLFAFGFIILNMSNLTQAERDHWLLKPIRLIGIGDRSTTKAPATALAPVPGGAPSKANAFQNAYGSSQREFETKRADFAQQYVTAVNEIKKSAVWNAANEWTINFAKQQSLTANKWIARVAKISTDQGGGKADVELVSDYAGMNITYRAAGSSSLKSGTLVYNKLAELSLGDIVEFDALFRESSKKGFDEDSWTERGSLEQPAFRINLTDIRKLADKSGS